MNKFILIGTLNKRDENRGISIAANNFQWNCIDLLRISTVISINAVHHFKDDRLDVKFLSTRDKFSFFMKSLKVFRSSSDRYIPLFYNIEWYTIHLIILSIVMRRKPRIIALDLSINSLLYKILLYFSDKPIVLRKNFILLSWQDYVLFPGFHSYDIAQIPATSNHHGKVRSILCGSLGPNTGLESYCNLAKVYGDVEFHISGIPHRISETDILKMIDENNENKNIFYHGTLSRKDYRELLHSCDLGFSLRVKNRENKYNFPSKILEYISAGLIPISSIDYEEYKRLQIFTSDFISEYKRLSIDNRQFIVTSNIEVLKEYNNYERFL